MDCIELTGSALTGIAPHSALMSSPLPRRVCLGRIAPKAQPSALKLESYMSFESSGPLPASTNRREKAMRSLGRMYMNDRYGCCVFSGKAHNLGLWSANDSDSPGEVFATDAEIEKQYFDYTGGRDVGANIASVLDIVRAKGFMASGRLYKIDGYVSVDWTNKELVKAAILLLGACSIGFDLPGAWQNSAVWDLTNSGIIGGHDVSPIDYDEQGVYVSSWGRIYLMTWAAFLSRRWIGEMYAILDPLWYNSDMIAPTGLDAKRLREDLAKIGNGIIPDIQPPPPPVPTPEAPYLIALGNDLPSGPCTITSGGVTIQANVSTARPAGTYLLTKQDPAPPQ